MLVRMGALALLAVAVVSSAVVSSVALAADQASFPGQQVQPDMGEQFEARTRIEGEDGTIPPVIERNPDPQAGPRIWVNRFKLDSLAEFPEDGVTREAVGRLVEQLRFDAMKLKEHIAYGYGRQDLVDIAQILADIEARGVFAEVTPLDVETLMEIVSGQRLQRGLTHGQLEEIAQAVTQYYRERGYILARAYIPAQEVTGGVVELRVLEGRLGNVQVQGEPRYNKKLLMQPFGSVLGGSVTADNIQEAMYLANDLPGIELFGYFTAGDQLGETKLNLNVREEKQWDALLRLDNQGTDFTGVYRLFGQAQWLNPTGIGDEMRVGVLQSGEPANSTYGMVEYVVPVFGLRNKLAVNASYNDYIVGGSADFEDLLGTTTTFEANFKHNFERGRRGNFYTGVLVANKQSDLAGIGGTFAKSEESRNAGVTIDWDQLYERQRLLARLVAQLDGGEVIAGLEDGQSDTFAKLYFEGSVLFFVPLPFTDKTNRMVVNTIGQWSDVKMPSVELFSLGGPNAVRAYGPTTFSADQALLVGAEWYPELPRVLDIDIAAGKSVADILQFTLFLDAGYGTQIALEPSTGPAPSDQWAALLGGGLGIRFDWGKRFSGQMSIAQPINSKFSDADTAAATEESVQVWVDLTYTMN